MTILPLQRMWERVEREKDNSDNAYFDSLMYMGELMTKLIAAGMVAVVSDSPDRQQYRLKYQLVRANGIGDWARAIDDVLTGVPAQFLMPESHNDAKQLTQRVDSQEWQYQSIELLDSCRKKITPDSEKLPNKVAGRNWFSIFTELRNKTRGHGAIPSGKLGSIAPTLEYSIRLFIENFSLFHHGWAYIEQTLKGKYRVTKWNDEAETLSFLKTQEGINFNLEAGLYIHFVQNMPLNHPPAKVDLIFSDIDSIDVYIPNGGYDDKRFEILSYISGNTRHEDAKVYRQPIGELPPSETQGLASLTDSMSRRTVTNLPPFQEGYIERSIPERRLYDELVDDNQHRIVTLSGRGGIGKTWLALKMLNQIAEDGIFDAILWFSARDIDLLPDGTKQVKPHILTEQDIAKEFKNLIGPFLLGYETFNSKEFDALSFLKSNMQGSSIGRILFVFDNFETVKSPGELYSWIESNLRLPNKALITTRFRDFKGDNPVELRGMSADESRHLIQKTANSLGIVGLLTSDYIDSLYKESDGHPYVIKILLGEVKKAQRSLAVEKIIATQENMLDTLFERTYSRLSPEAQRVFLTLCSWKSFVAEMAIQAVMLRPEVTDEKVDIIQAIDDLHNSSMIEKTISNEDDTIFWSVPLVAMQFGQRKLGVSRLKIAIQQDVALLQFFGSVQNSDIQKGVGPRIFRLTKSIERELEKGEPLENLIPLLELIAQKYSPAWLPIAELYEKNNQIQKAEQTYQRFLESSSDNYQKRLVWKKLAQLYSVHSRYGDELFALSELVQIPNTDYDAISSAANRFNTLMNLENVELSSFEKSHFVDLLIQLMEKRIEEADAIDCSRLAWLYLHKGNRPKAQEITYRGLEIDPKNEFCLRLIQKL